MAPALQLVSGRPLSRLYLYRLQHQYSPQPSRVYTGSSHCADGSPLRRWLSLRRWRLLRRLLLLSFRTISTIRPTIAGLASDPGTKHPADQPSQRFLGQHPGPYRKTAWICIMLFQTQTWSWILNRMFPPHWES